jgi:hypothetical protein
MRFIVLAVSLALCAASASAQTIFTSVSLDGHKSFSDRADAATESVPELDPESSAPKAAGRRPLVSSRLSATVNLHEAERRLALAQLKRQQGLEPLPGERAQGSATRVSYRYWRRQERLRLDVEKAQQRVNATGPAQLVRR